ncbi:MAG: geranylgeranylglyceryl/heptaprenylglyceryl phosphate synthase [Bacteroidia bacterium]
MKSNNFFQNHSCRLAVLVDPDKYNPRLIKMLSAKHVGFIFIGGSKLKKNNISTVVKSIKKQTRIPVILFPGDEKQLNSDVDGIMVLSLVSGRNPEYLIGKLVKSAEKIKKLVIPTTSVAYVLCGKYLSTTAKVSGTKPISNKKELRATVIAAELLGLQNIYLEAGSGAASSIDTKEIKAIRKITHLPVIVGGGIKTTEQIKKVKEAGANIIVIGNCLEKNPELIIDFQKIF